LNSSRGVGMELTPTSTRASYFQSQKEAGFLIERRLKRPFEGRKKIEIGPIVPPGGNAVFRHTLRATRINRGKWERKVQGAAREAREGMEWRSVNSGVRIPGSLHQRTKKSKKKLNRSRQIPGKKTRHAYTRAGGGAKDIIQWTGE